MRFPGFSPGTRSRKRQRRGSAGFDDVRVVEVARPARFASIDDWVHTEIRGWTLSASIDDDMYDAFLAEARSRWTRFVDDDGAVAYPSPALVATARRP